MHKKPDTLVLIDTEMLLAAFCRAREVEPGLTWRTVAGRADTSHQRISAILNSKGTRRCQRAFRDRLAKVLRVPPEILSGVARSPDFFFGPGILNPRGTGAPENWAEHDLPPVRFLVLNHFMCRCRDRIMVDLKARHGAGAEDEFRAWGYRFVLALSALVDPDQWRQEFTTSHSMPDRVSERRLISFAETWEEILAGWLDGKATLNFDVVFPVLRALRHTYFIRLAGMREHGRLDVAGGLDGIERKARESLDHSYFCELPTRKRRRAKKRR